MIFHQNHSEAVKSSQGNFGQAIWGGIWKCTVEKSQVNVTNVTLHPLRQAIWGGVWKRTVEDAGNLRRLLKIHSGEKLNICSQCYFASSHAGNLNVWVVLQWKKSAIYVTMEDNFFADRLTSIFWGTDSIFWEIMKWGPISTIFATITLDPQVLQNLTFLSNNLSPILKEPP